MMKTVLITGINGIIGWNLFQASPNSVEAHGTFRKRHKRLRGPFLHRINLESTEEVEFLMGELKPELIIHSWGICDLDVCEQLPEMAWRINVEGTKRFLKAAEACSSVKRFVYISTDHVFDGEKAPYDEFSPAQPKHVYGKTKREAELLVSEALLSTLIIRPGLVIGESFQGNKGPRDFLFSRIQENKPTHLFTDEWRTPIGAKELAERVWSCAFSGAEGTLHLAGGKVWNRYDLARELAAKHKLSTDQIFPRKRAEDQWAKIRPKNLSLISKYEQHSAKREIAEKEISPYAI